MEPPKHTMTADEKNDSPIHLEIGDNDDDDDNSDLRSGSYKPTKKPLCGCHSFTIKMWLCFLACSSVKPFRSKSLRKV